MNLHIGALALIGSVKAVACTRRSKCAGPLMIMNKMPVSLACDLHLSAYMVLRAMRAYHFRSKHKDRFLCLERLR